MYENKNKKCYSCNQKYKMPNKELVTISKKFINGLYLLKTNELFKCDKGNIKFLLVGSKNKIGDFLGRERIIKKNIISKMSNLYIKEEDLFIVTNFDKYLEEKFKPA